MAKKRDETKDQERIALELRYEFPSDQAISSFANHMLVQIDEHDFHISFFQVTPPILLGTESEKKEQLKKLETVPARCVARIVVAEGLMPKIIQALQTNLEKKRGVDSQHANGRGKSHDKTA